MANAIPNRAMAQKALQEAEAAIKAAKADLEGSSDPAPAAAPTKSPVAPAAPVKAAQAVNQKHTKARRTLGHTADSSNLQEAAAVKIGAALSMVAQYVNASKAGTPADVARQKYNELIAAINAGV